MAMNTPSQGWVASASSIVLFKVTDVTPVAVGFALKAKRRGENHVVTCFFGDGATEEGVFYESLNFAALKRLPVIFVCENNLYAIHTHQSLRQRSANICERARVLGMPAELIKDDVFQVHERVSAAVQALRSGEPGPFFFECLTYRWKEHVGPNDDFHLGYRSREEAEPWFKNDQVKKVAEMVDDRRRQEIEQEVEREIQDAFDFAEASPFPERAELFTHVFKGS